MMQMRTSGRTHACYGGTNATSRNLDLTPNLKYETMVVGSSHSSKSHFMSKSRELLETVLEPVKCYFIRKIPGTVRNRSETVPGTVGIHTGTVGTVDIIRRIKRFIFF